MASILAFGAYIPRFRLQRSIISAANAWVSKAPGALRKGSRSTANWDEDVVTMAVAAGQSALARQTVDEVWLASTTAPFVDRRNSGIVSGALGLNEETTASMDFGGSQCAATSALISALRTRNRRVLVAAAEKRRTKVASTAELTSGDGAAAFVVGDGDGLADVLATAQSTVDFVDHYRAADQAFDYVWEERWLRDEGYRKLVPKQVKQALGEAGVQPQEVSSFVFPAIGIGVAEMVAKALGIRADAVADSYFDDVGHCGVAQPLLMLAGVLEKAGEGDVIVVVGFGQGVDVIVLRVTARHAAHDLANSLPRQIERGIETGNYMRFLSHNRLLEQELGMRAELDLQTQPTVMYRNRQMLHAFVGGRCAKCGAIQFPKHAICVAPDCGAEDTQEDFRLAEMPGRLQSHTADLLTYSPDPPARYGMVNFRDGGCLMMDITDAQESEVEAGAAVRPVFRIKREDTRRGIKSYFWKVAPMVEPHGERT
ncbi:MAG: zinc ribbon domain-containing protein [Rhizobiaceae bacterium]|nr:zinc ribbon domain-containing protein [Rhizobiaceae bacterium]